MATIQLLIRLPEELARRFRRAVAVRQRSKFIEELLEHALPPSDGGDADPLYLAALAVEGEGALSDDMAGWEAAAVADGLAEAEPPAGRR